MFAACLVEPDADVSLPVFAEMYVGEYVVMFNHLSITKVLYLIN